MADETRPMRSKEFANDYRYFPEPDLLPVVLEDSFIQSIQKEMPELPEEKKKRFISEHNLSEYDAEVLSVDLNLSKYFEEVVNITNDPKLTANWVMGELSAFLNKENLSINETKVEARLMGQLLNKIKDSTISGKIAKEVFEEMWATKKGPEEIIEGKGLQQMTDSNEIEDIIDQVLEENISPIIEKKPEKIVETQEKKIKTPDMKVKKEEPKKESLKKKK